jgi:hypothetical protein
MAGMEASIEHDGWRDVQQMWDYLSKDGGWVEQPGDMPHGGHLGRSLHRDNVPPTSFGVTTNKKNFSSMCVKLKLSL